MGGEGGGGFLRSRQTKYNSTSYKEGSRRDEGSLSLSLSSRIFSFPSFLFSLSAACSLQEDGRGGGGGDEPS